MDPCIIPRSSHGIMDEQEEDVAAAATSAASSADDEETSESIDSSSSEFTDDGSSSEEEKEGPLFQMSGLIAHLPFRRGLSKHFQGKSQSFSSLSDVRRLEDLAKPEKTYKKNLNASRRYGRVLDYNKALFCARTITKKPSRGQFSSLGPKRNVVLRSTRPTFPSLGSSGDLPGQALLFA